MMTIRDATEADFNAITSIYAYNVLNGTGTFALEPPSRGELVAAYHAVRAMRLPYLVADIDGEIAGYAYASPFRTRPGYRYSIEDSVYLAPSRTGQGIGKQLLGRLISDCTARGLYSMIAVIGDADNAASIGVHSSSGFIETGRLPRAGYKFGRWLDVVFMTRPLLPEADLPSGGGWADED